MGSWLTGLRAVVRKRCTSTWSSSATSILASPPPPVSLPTTLDLCLEHRAHIYNRSFDLQVRRYRQAYHREVREGKNFTLSLPSHTFPPYRDFCPSVGQRARFPQSANFLRPDIFGTTTSVDCCPTIDFLTTPRQFPSSSS